MTRLSISMCDGVPMHSPHVSSHCQKEVPLTGRSSPTRSSWPNSSTYRTGQSCHPCRGLGVALSMSKAFVSSHASCERLATKDGRSAVMKRLQRHLAFGRFIIKTAGSLCVRWVAHIQQSIGWPRDSASSGTTSTPSQSMHPFLFTLPPTNYIVLTK
jgi:hypothetical protein